MEKEKRGKGNLSKGKKNLTCSIGLRAELSFGQLKKSRREERLVRGGGD